MLRTMRVLAALVLGSSAVGACGLLDVNDPTKLQDEELQNGAAADLLRRDAITTFNRAFGLGAMGSALLSDELWVDVSPTLTSVPKEALLDRRESVPYEPLATGTYDPYGAWQEARHSTLAALPRVRAYMADASRAAYTGQLFAVRGYTTLRLAEDFCPGFALNDIVDGKMTFGAPMTNAQLFERALADFDSAVTFSADTARFLNLSKVGRARTLLGLGRFAEAATAVQGVPDDFVWNAEFAVSWQENLMAYSYYQYATARNSVGDGSGGGIPFSTAGDPRVKSTVGGLGFDGTTEIRSIDKYPTVTEPIVVASGVEARLVEAEAALNGGGDWLTKLNALRTDGTQAAGVWNAGTGGVAGLAPLADPGTDAARVDLLFRERAFWLFGTGSRLADLRRLVAHYNRTPDSVFPSGVFRVGGVYGTATSIPFPADVESAENPAVAGGCTSR